ncbi:MAG: hypothetical protein C0467_01090 [Planctomycetaceae bacterium]|nr:hypothetical protein [Planctomycetaceae bacterium]
MAKAKSEAKSDSNAEPKSNPAIIQDIVEKIGRDTVTDEAVRDILKKDYKGVDLSPSTLKQYIYSARKKLGWVKTRGAGGASKGGDEPTLSDLMNARKVAEEVGMSPEKLLDLVGKLSKFGDHDTLTACLEALVELSD